MKVCKLDLDVKDPKLAQIIINGLKRITCECVKEMNNSCNTYRWHDDKVMPYKIAQKINEISHTLMELTKQIESCEDGSKLIED